jgi:hypothetical protein
LGSAFIAIAKLTGIVDHLDTASVSVSVSGQKTHFKAQKLKYNNKTLK